MLVRINTFFCAQHRTIMCLLRRHRLMDNAELQGKSCSELLDIIQATRRKAVLTDADRALIRRASDVYRAKAADKLVKRQWGASNMDLIARN